MPAASCLRVRSPAFSCAALGLGAAAHEAGHGELPAMHLLVLCAVLMESAFTALGRRGPVVSALALVVAQAGLHTVFSLGAPVHHSAESLSVMTTPTMTAAHLAAAALTGLLLAHGDRLAQRALAVLLPVLLVVGLRPFVPAPLLRSLPPRSADRPRDPLLTHLFRRGPPRLLAPTP